ncbi:NAD-dependent epimerase/dehydratase family protein [Caenimonas aquaedulcis]|uniref:NAD(P)-dependent oxidoreductase n=1 Tax=Caenimonas aquaedulcis TaxID=2793270 RepID=A0A931MIG4_9BURK|nr:NAD(P)-dependent oxidoreductase [Caenimonas aquaedulcis]MBG9390106.1 NAD(P)-dependent oxidoreductase [Caenimonas aquaedulcis]
MKILVLGGSGYIGSRLCAMLSSSGWATPINGSARRNVPGIENRRVDTRDKGSMFEALRGVDAVVNCVAGSADAIASGAAALTHAAIEADCQRIVHLSSMSVYGSQQGVLNETAALDPTMGWYAKAKCESEERFRAFASTGGSVVTFRPGCVWGPGSELWVGRVSRWLRAHRLGDLGEAGDGWSNLVHVDDVCAAIEAALRLPQPVGQVRTYNLAAPDSPRWNEYFTDLALATGATPVKRIHPRQLKVDAFVLGPILKAAEIGLSKLGRDVAFLPDPLSPGLVALFDRHLKLDSQAAERDLGLKWTGYDTTLRQAALWCLQRDGIPSTPPSRARPVARRASGTRTV